MRTAPHTAALFFLGLVCITSIKVECACGLDRPVVLVEGGEATHNRLLADAALRLAGCEALMLAHFPTSRAAAAVTANVNCPVLTSPGSAVRRLRRAIQQTTD